MRAVCMFDQGSLHGSKGTQPPRAAISQESSCAGTRPPSHALSIDRAREHQARADDDSGHGTPVRSSKPFAQLNRSAHVAQPHYCPAPTEPGVRAVDGLLVLGLLAATVPFEG